MKENEWLISNEKGALREVLVGGTEESQQQGGTWHSRRVTLKVIPMKFMQENYRATDDLRKFVHGIIVSKLLIVSNPHLSSFVNVNQLTLQWRTNAS